VISKELDYVIYEQSGEETEDEAVREYFGNIDNEAIISTLSKNSKYYRIPANN
jgi:hypothetical protein